jgi:NADPH:quinone reductase-like Zn-dependent oxidoreductase
LGAWKGVNYRTTPEWGQAVQELTGGRGADIVVEVGGAGTLGQSMAAVAFGGEIGLIGVLTGTEGAAGPHPVMRKAATMRGIFVGSRAMFEDLNRAIDANAIKPVVGQAFAFEDAAEAYRFQESDKLFGKVVIRV